MRATILRRAVWPVAAAGLMAASRVFACSVCYTDPASPTTRAANLAILTLLGIVGAVLTAIAAIAISWSRKARSLEGDGHAPTPRGGAASARGAVPSAG